MTHQSPEKRCERCVDGKVYAGRDAGFILKACPSCEPKTECFACQGYNYVCSASGKSPCTDPHRVLEKGGMAQHDWIPCPSCTPSPASTPCTKCSSEYGTCKDCMNKTAYAPSTEEAGKEGKTVLDACCGSRMFWLDRQDPRAVFMDIRDEEHVLCDGRTLKVAPDTVGDFRAMPFPDRAFKLVVFDPPHLLKAGSESWMAKKYGLLDRETWQADILGGFNECWRVLDDWGTLIFKWSERDVKVKTVLGLLPERPLFGHPSGKAGMTHWLCFLKQPTP